MQTLTEYLGGFLLNDQRSDIIPSFLVVFGVCAVTVWKLLGPPAAAVDGLVADVLHVEAVHYFGAVFVD